MYHINKYTYVCKKSRSKCAIYARNVEFADMLAEKVTKLGVFSFRRAKIRFIRPVITEIPPYELEQEQLETIEEWEKRNNTNN